MVVFVYHCGMRIRLSSREPGGTVGSAAIAIFIIGVIGMFLKIFSWAKTENKKWKIHILDFGYCLLPFL